MPTPLWKKLNLKDELKLVILGAPAEFEPHVDALAGMKVARSVRARTDATFLIAFAITLEDIERAAKAIAKLPESDVIVWICYPKQTSNCYTCEFNRDTGWQPLGDLGYEGVRQVAVDDDWSAIRFRRIEFIKTMKRDPKRALTAQGRKK